MIAKLLHLIIYRKRNRRNKLWSSTQLGYNKVENNTSNSYLCGGNNYAERLFTYYQLSCVHVNQHVNQTN